MKRKKMTLTPYGIDVKKALLDRQITQTEFCDKYKIPISRFSEVLHGTRPGNKYREIIAKVLGVEESA